MTTPPIAGAPLDRLAQLSQAGVSLWLNELSRRQLHSGELAQLIQRDHVVGAITTDPLISRTAIRDGVPHLRQPDEADGADTKAAVRGDEHRRCL